MSGHSKWATIKRKKAVTDARRGKLFTQIIKEITIAAKLGGGHPEGNPRLRMAIDKAKEHNMPADNVKRAVMKGTGELPGVNYEDVVYEAYGPGGVAMIIEAVTDNKIRTVSEVRHALEHHHGKLASAGSVAFQFHRKGLVIIPRSAVAEDDLMNVALEAGADDLKVDDDSFTVVCPPDNYEAVRKAILDRGIRIESSEIHLVPDNTVHLEGKEAEGMVKLMEAIEDHDDIQHVFANFEIDDKVLAGLAGSA